MCEIDAGVLEILSHNISMTINYISSNTFHDEALSHVHKMIDYFQSISPRGEHMSSY
jgi:hypothetical protein